MKTTLSILISIMLLTSCSLAQQNIQQDSIVVQIEPISWVDVVDTTTWKVIDSVQVNISDYEIFAKEVSTPDSILLTTISDTTKSWIDLGTLGKGIWKFGYRGVHPDYQSGDIHWSTDDTNQPSWSINYTPEEFIIRIIRKGSFIGMEITRKE